MWWGCCGCVGSGCDSDGVCDGIGSGNSDCGGGGGLLVNATSTFWYSTQWDHLLHPLVHYIQYTMYIVQCTVYNLY